MPPRKKKEKVVEEPKSLEAMFEQQLASVGLSGALRLADSYDNNYDVVTSGWPGVDRLISDLRELQGIPKNVHIEVFSEVEHAGKTSFTLAIGVIWQLLGFRVGIVDIEPSITLAYLKQLGYITDKKEAEARGLYAVRLLQPQIKAEECDTDMVYVDKVLDTVSIASNYFDLMIVDSVDALVSEADAAKTTTTADQMGGVSKQIKSFFRKNTRRRSTIFWINHMSQGLGQYAKAYTTGGKAIPRYSTIRFRIDRVDFIRPTPESEPIGFVSKITMIKNRLGPIGRSTLLYYLFGEGFSVDYDYFLTALRIGIINRNKGWFYVGKDKDNSKLTIQGEHNMYLALKNDHKEIFKELKALVDGEDVEPEIGEEEISDEDLLAGMEVEEDNEEQQAA
jgi:RecA/RadA recombinase